MTLHPEWQDNGSRAYLDNAGKIVAVITPRFEYASIIDYRTGPWPQTVPCIYCSAAGDVPHDPALHVRRSP